MDFAWLLRGSDEHAAGAAMRRRRLRSWLRHERMTVAMALAEMKHHTAPRGLKMVRAWEEGHEEYDAPRRQKPPPPQQVLFSLYEEEPGGRRRASLAEPPGPQERSQRPTVEQLGELAPMVKILDATVQQTVDQLVEVLRPLDTVVPEQVIEAPKITLHDVIPLRAVLPVPQMAEQLVDEPIPSFDDSSLLRLARRRRSSRTWSRGLAYGTPRAMRCAGSWVRRGSTGGVSAPPSPSGPSWRGSSPGEGGIEILAAVTVADVAVVDVPLNMQHRYSVCSSSPVERILRDSVPSTECWTFQLCHRREIPQCSP